MSDSNDPVTVETSAQTEPAQPAEALTAGLIVRGLLALFLVAVLVSWGRAAVESHRYFAWGQQADAEQDWESAVLHYRHALQWYAPAFSKSASAFDALVEIGDAQAAEQNTEAALVAYRSARWGVMAIQHIGAPLADNLPPLHQKIGALMGQQGPEAGRADRAQRYTDQLDAWRTRRPNPVIGTAASVGFMLWIAALFMLAWRGFKPDGSLDRPAFAKHFGAVIVTLAFWLICVRLA